MVIIGCEINVFFAFIHHDLLTYHPFSLAFDTFGQGNRTFIAFHGFGQDGFDYQIFESAKKEEWQIFAFHWFFHHSQSKYPADRITKNEISKKEFAALFIQFLNDRGIEKIGLMAHSMGGKMAMALVEEIPERIREVIFFAADGIEQKFWNGFSVNNPIGRLAFKSIIRFPWFSLALGKILLKTGLMNEKIYAVSVAPLKDKMKRLQIFKTWMSGRYLFPNMDKFNAAVLEHQIDLKGIYGKKDKIIKLSKALEWEKHFAPKKIIYPIKTGHIILKKKYVDKLVEIIET
ncbi:MAG: alpha/beta hydrolase [Bacteroidota bacterium]